MSSKPSSRVGVQCSLAQRLLAVCGLAVVLAAIAPIVHSSSASATASAPSQSFDLAAGNGGSRAIWSDGTTMWVTNLSGRLFAYDLATMARDSGKDIAALAWRREPQRQRLVVRRHHDVGVRRRRRQDLRL